MAMSQSWRTALWSWTCGQNAVSMAVEDEKRCEEKATWLVPLRTEVKERAATAHDIMHWHSYYLVMHLTLHLTLHDST